MDVVATSREQRFLTAACIPGEALPRPGGRAAVGLPEALAPVLTCFEVVRSFDSQLSSKKQLPVK